MKISTLTSAALIIACILSSPGYAKTYNCHLNAPLALSREGETVKLTEINFPGLDAEPWNFSVEIKVGKKNEPDQAVVSWPSNPIQIAGQFPVLPTASGALAFTTAGFGGCMFTVKGCLAVVQIVEQELGKAKISVLPTALWTDGATNKSEPFVAIIDGICSWKDS